MLCLVVLVAGSATACNPAQKAKQVKHVVDTGNAAACAQDKLALEKAVSAFILMNPDTPVTEQAIVSGGILHLESTLMDIAADGTIVPAPGTVCA